METTINIDGKDVRLKSTAMVPIMYRSVFGRDMMRDIGAAATAGDDKIGAMSVETIGRIAYIMAKHADPGAIPDSLEEWLESISTMAIYSMIPTVMALWTGNLTCLEDAKKKVDQSIENSQRRSSCSEPSGLESPSGTLST